MENKDYLEEARQYGYVQDNEIWLKPFMNYPARKVGEVKEVEEESLQYFAYRFEMFREKVNALLKKIEESENKGSFLMKVMHLKEQVEKYDALGDFEAIYNQLSQAENEIKASISRNRDKNLNAKVALITEAEELQDSIDWKGTTEKLKELRQNWIKTGPVDKAIADEIEERFRNAVETFFTRKKDFYEDKQSLVNRTIDKYRDLIAKAEAIQNSDDWDVATAKLKEYQTAWKQVGGNLPRKTTNDLWNRFRKANNHFFERLKNRITQTKTESKEKYFEENLSKKRALVEEAEGLVNVEVQRAVPRAKELQAAWKTVGPVKGEESDRLWERFIIACDKVFELSSLEHYLRKKNMGAKIAPNEQVTVRVNALKDFIKSDRQELEVLETNLGKLADTPGNETFRNMLQSKIRGFNRKIKTKQELIDLIKNKQVAGSE
ncbi:DUF349 domain-containing protein [Adhaeribacter rhizoryzae]|uniref:DUF349 domain-containing protein n=1 Tax=Adhaeribacter rhizoryzae TaxID=2607907 RepID=A0A5M6DH90_9BACT|nr:DUF349 domain-containing protein [Adhaeribacter rhizoryzae]KAA5545622.1 DUF349 domain-containing protein [Adhaeribacter rhizoryzae]